MEQPYRKSPVSNEAKKERAGEEETMNKKHLGKKEMDKSTEQNIASSKRSINWCAIYFTLT